MDKFSSVTCPLYSDDVKGDPNPTWLRKYQEEDEEEVVKRAIKESEIFVSEIFYNFFLFISFQSLSFIIVSLPFLPRTFTHTHDLYPLPTTHEPRHLATLKQYLSLNKYFVFNLAGQLRT